MATCDYKRGESGTTCKTIVNGTCNGRCWQHCEVGHFLDARMKALHGVGYTQWQIAERYQRLMDEWIDHAVEVHGEQDNRPPKTANGKYNGPWAFTLTMSPSDGLNEEDMKFACRKVMDQKSQPVKRFAWYLEYKDPETKQHPHIHGMYETANGRRIERKHWMRAWKIWDETIPLGFGFRGGYHRPVRAEEAYSDYIAKQSGDGDAYNIE